MSYTKSTVTNTTRLKEEDLCNGCGKCCEILDSGYACPNLNVKTNRCINYSNRFKVFPCAKAVDVLDKLPRDCPYVTGVQPEKVDYAVLKPYALMPGKLRRHVDKQIKEHVRHAKQT